MVTVESVTGPVGPQAAGWALPHEHTYVNLHPSEPRDGYLTVRQERLDDLARFTAAGGTMIWDVTNGELSNHAAPIDLDRDPADERQNPLTGSRSVANVLATREISRAAGVSIVLGTGHYFDAYLDPDWWDRHSVDAIAEHLVADLTEEIPGTGVRAGFLGEIGSDLPYITAREERSFRATGRAAARTGVLVSTHAPTFPTGRAQLELLRAEGVEADRVVIGHADTVKTPQYSLDLLRRGAWIEYDCMMTCKSGGRINQIELARRIDYLKVVIDAGYAGKVLLSQDVSQRSQQHASGGPGLTFLVEEFTEAALAAGIESEVLHSILRDNPRRAMFGQ